MTVQFHTLSKKIGSASLALTISSLFLCDGNAMYVLYVFSLCNYDNKNVKPMCRKQKLHECGTGKILLTGHMSF